MNPILKTRRPHLLFVYALATHTSELRFLVGGSRGRFFFVSQRSVQSQNVKRGFERDKNEVVRQAASVT